MIPHNKKYSEEVELEICQKYINGLSTYQLAKEYNFKRHKSISDILKRHNIRTRNSDELRELTVPYANFSFAKIDSLEKAYFLGLLLTDGYVIKSENSYIGISLTDRDAMELIQKLTNAKIYELPMKDKMTKPAYRIHLYGKKLISEVERFGLIPRKTFTLGDLHLYPEEEQYFPYILRGIIDGDGWIRKDGKEFFISSASENFLKYLTAKMNSMGFQIHYKFHNNEYSGYYLIRSAVKNNLSLLKTLVYDKPFGMKQKFNLLYQLDI